MHELKIAYRRVAALRAARGALGVLVALSGATGATAQTTTNTYVPGPPQNLPHVEHPAPMEASPGGVYGLEHTHILTGDIERSVHFYVDVLGFTQASPVRDMPTNPRMDQLLGFKSAHYKVTLLNMPGGPSYGTHVPQIEIWEVHDANSLDKADLLDKSIYDKPTGNFQGKGYNAYRVKDLASILPKLKAAGIRFVSDPVLRDGVPAAIYVVDPDGQLIELDNWFG
jgi:catechol 2,3-dioxygenase-like lactoylglutathione lyase family enzyme